eukprot:CAMPEP_0179928518 /NCGR_PEP_ID=MMETSP0983-20121128/8912_1 /TAXON_ID=483367 /ORGANISM="non described non described, Strain CCMP 2436" /LENGTH=168 /DNA_ID=CAMNT_0021832331 /DNA_START=216 /DNA_END=723 /DNA_ORIENTATION=-
MSLPLSPLPPSSLPRPSPTHAARGSTVEPEEYLQPAASGQRGGRCAPHHAATATATNRLLELENELGHGWRAGVAGELPGVEGECNYTQAGNEHDGEDNIQAELKEVDLLARDQPAERGCALLLLGRIPASHLILERPAPLCRLRRHLRRRRLTLGPAVHAQHRLPAT